jgi:hypothetical protein
MIQSPRHWRINITKQYSLMRYPSQKYAKFFKKIITNLNFTIFNIQTNKKFYRGKRHLVRYQRLNVAFCTVASNRIYNQPDDGLEKKAETCS